MGDTPRLRLPICLHSGRKKPQPQCVLVVASNASTADVLAAASNKLRLKKKDVTAARLFVHPSGVELPRDSAVTGRVQNDQLVVITVGEPYVGAAASSAAAEPVAAPSESAARWLRWEARPSLGSLAVVEWSDARAMNATLGRLSTLLEHPTLCGAETRSVVGHEEQRGLPSSQYLGHNLYAATFAEFERLASESTSDAERAFLGLWRERGAPEVVISFVSGARETLRHELCHARFALDVEYRTALTEAWEGEWQPTLHRWMRDLGYHPGRHADEFGAYLLTEPASFWRGRIAPAQLGALRERLGGGNGGCAEGGFGGLGGLELDGATPSTAVDGWFNAV